MTVDEPTTPEPVPMIPAAIAAEPALEADSTPVDPPPAATAIEPHTDVPTSVEATVEAPAPVVDATASPPVEAVATAEPPPPAVPALPPQPVPQVPPAPQPHDLSRLAQDLQIRKAQVEAVVQLLDDLNTVPFITRYRKERTGGLDEVAIRRIESRVGVLRDLANRKQTILRSIANQGRLTDDLTAAILAADNPKRLDDLYLPYKPKKRTLASDAKEKGLEPLALAIWTRDPAVEKLDEVLPGMIDPWKQLHTAEDVLTGVKHILAEVIADQADVRGPLRAFVWDTALLATIKADGVPEGKGTEYRDYFSFTEPVRAIPPHRVLAVNRGERENVIRVKMTCDPLIAKAVALDHLPIADHPHRDLLIPVVEDALSRLVIPSLEREVRRELAEHAQDHAVDIFARNLSSLLLRAPLGPTRVLAIDPGIRTGCKLAVLDETGTMLEDAVIYPHAGAGKLAEAKRKLEQLVRKYQTTVIAIGNGTACRETEQLVSDLIAGFEERRVNPPPAPSPLDALPTSLPVESMPTELPVETASATAMVDASPMPAAESFATTFAPVLPGDAIETAMVSTGLPAEPTAIISAPDAPGSEPTVVQSPAVPAAIPAPAAPIIVLDGLPEPPVDLAYVIVNEAGASDYSASPVAKEEFPNLDATTRGTISIGRRLQDPLSELVKIDPQHVGVGLYQHDVRPKYLKESVEAVIESCVNGVGVDLNTASVPLLKHVSGLNQLAARQVVEYRKQNGPFKSREQLRNVPQMGDIRFTQAAGFLKVRDGDDPLDTTWVHPESYPLARQILADLGFAPEDLRDKAKLTALREKLPTLNVDEVAARLGAGGPTIYDIFHAIARPGRDLRDDRPKPIFRKGVLKLEDLSPGMELKGEVLNVVDFGAFVDVGLKDSGLVHISQVANRYIKSPYDVVAVGDVVPVWVISVDAERRRVSLTMIAPGQERRPPGRQQGDDRRGGDRPQQYDRPPQGDRPPRQDRPPQQFDRPPQGDRPPQQYDRPPQGDRPPRQDRPPMPQQRPPMQPSGDRPPMPQQRPGGFAPRPGGGGPGRGPQRGPGAPGWRSGPKPAAPSTPPGEGTAPPLLTPPVADSTKKPPRQKSAPKVSDSQKAGKEPVYSFAQLAALLKSKDEPPPAPPEVKPPEAPPAPETPTAD